MFKTHSQTMDYSVHANIIYRITKYINWPDNRKTGDFIIGIVGETPLYDEIVSFTAGKSVGNQKIVIRKVPPSGPFINYHILFIAEDKSRSLKKICTATAGFSVLLVTETEGSGSRGACINFTLVDDRIKLEINKINIEQRNLAVASELLQLGIPVK